jgi:hypothetical protein
MNSLTASLVGVRLQPELAQSLDEFLPEPLSIGRHLESGHDLIGEPDNNNDTCRFNPAHWS